MKRSQFFQLLSGASISGFLLWASPIQAQVNVTHQLGVLGPSDQQSDAGRYFDSYQIEGIAGQRISISLDSSDFDTFLGLIDSDHNLVATNDDAASDNLNSYISTVLPQSGTYTVVATSINPNSGGDYRMSMRNFASPQTARNSRSNVDWQRLNAFFSHPVVQEATISAISSMFSFGGTSSSSSTAYPYPPYPNQSATSSQPTGSLSAPPIGGDSGLYGGGPQHGTRNAW